MIKKSLNSACRSEDARRDQHFKSGQHEIAGHCRRPVRLKFARDARGRASNLYEAKLYRSTNATRRALLCPVLWVSRDGTVQIMRAAKPLTDMMSLDDYMQLAEVWEKMPGEDSCPFEPKASDWG